MSNRINLDFADPKAIINGTAGTDVPSNNNFDPDLDSYGSVLAKLGINEVSVPWSPDGQPDWISFNVGAGGDLGGSVTVTIDRWNRVYYSSGGGLGMGSG